MVYFTANTTVAAAPAATHMNKELNAPNEALLNRPDTGTWVLLGLFIAAIAFGLAVILVSTFKKPLLKLRDVTLCCGARKGTDMSAADAGRYTDLDKPSLTTSIATRLRKLFAALLCCGARKGKDAYADLEKQQSGSLPVIQVTDPVGNEEDYVHNKVFGWLHGGRRSEAEGGILPSFNGSANRPSRQMWFFLSPYRTRRTQTFQAQPRSRALPTHAGACEVLSSQALAVLAESPDVSAYTSQTPTASPPACKPHPPAAPEQVLFGHVVAADGTAKRISPAVKQGKENAPIRN